MLKMAKQIYINEAPNNPSIMSDEESGLVSLLRPLGYFPRIADSAGSIVIYFGRTGSIVHTVSFSEKPCGKVRRNEFEVRDSDPLRANVMIETINEFYVYNKGNYKRISQVNIPDFPAAHK
jgi:hypothetical protein